MPAFVTISKYEFFILDITKGNYLPFAGKQDKFRFNNDNRKCIIHYV